MSIKLHQKLAKYSLRQPTQVSQKEQNKSVVVYKLCKIEQKLFIEIEFANLISLSV